MSLALFTKNLQQKNFLMAQKPIWCTAWSILAGLCIALSLPPYTIPGLIWVAFLPFLLLLYFPIESSKKLFFYGWVTGLAATWPTFNWVFEGAPYTWLGVQSYVISSLLGIFGLGLPTVLFALAFGSFLVVARKLVRDDPWDILTLGLLWGVIEYSRVLAYSFYPFQLGSGAIVGEHMTFAITAYAFSELENIRQFVTIIGPYGLGAMAVAVNSSIFYILRRRLLPRGGITLLREVLIFLAIGFIFFVVAVKTGQVLKTKFLSTTRTINIALVQLASSPEDVIQPGHFSRTRALITSLVRSLISAGDSFDILLLPENVGVFNSRRGPPKLSAEDVKKFLGGTNYRVMIEGSFPDMGAEKDRIAIFDTASGLASIYDKRFLMPYGEYMPDFLKYPLLFFGKNRFLTSQIQMTPGEKPAVQQTKIGNIATLICSEILSPQLIRSSARNGGEILVFTAAITMLRGAPKYHEEVMAAAKTWATMTRRYLAYAGNAEPVFVIDELGNIQWENPNMNPGIVIQKARLNSAQTPAVQYPFGFLIVAGVFLGVVGALKIRNTKEL